MEKLFNCLFLSNFICFFTSLDKLKLYLIFLFEFTLRTRYPFETSNGFVISPSLKLLISFLRLVFKLFMSTHPILPPFDEVFEILYFKAAFSKLYSKNKIFYFIKISTKIIYNL